MAIEKDDPTFAERFLAPLMGIFLGSSFLGMIVLGACMEKHERLGVVLFCVILVAMITSLAVLHHRVLGRYQCPQCQARLPRHKDPARKRDFLFYCQKCDVVWKTGLQEGDS